MNTKLRFSLLYRSFAIIFFITFGTENIFAVQNVERFKPIDIPVPHSQQGIKNVWDDVIISGLIKAPDGITHNANGFYHSKDLWMVRFAPDQVGMWKYQLSVSDKNGQTQIIDSFNCVASIEQGFIRLHPANPKRWIYSGTGNLYTAVGFGDCMGAARDSILADADLLDGGYRPKGYHEGISWILPYSQYLISYGEAAGFNIYRYSDGNCAYSIIKNISHSGNDYDTLHSLWTDTLFYALRAHGFRIYMTIMAGPQGNSSDNNSMAATERYAQYCIDRYGSLVDFWELTNESNPDSLWISKIAGYLHDRDPYHHLVSMSNQTPYHPAIDIISPHWYGKEDARNSDEETGFRINYEYGFIKKPVIFGEQGDGGWDSLSAMRMRGRIWSALFNEGIIIFWNSTFAKDCPCNQYLGWEERRYVRVLQNFAELLDSGVRKTEFSQAGNLNIWGLQSRKEFALYIRDFSDVNEVNSGKQISVNSTVYGTGYFYDVHTGDIIGRSDISLGQQWLTIPNFQTDIAFISRNQTPNQPAADSLFRIDVNPRTEMLLNSPVNKPQTFFLQITNIGKNPITLIKNWVSSPSKILSFVIRTPFPITLSPSQSMMIPVEYTMHDTGGTGAMISFLQSASPSWENVAISATGIPQSKVFDSKNNQEEIQIYPDPASELLTIKWLLSHQKKITARLSNVDGATMTEKILNENNEAIFDIKKYEAGVYTVTILSENYILSSKKVIVMH